MFDAMVDRLHALPDDGTPFRAGVDDFAVVPEQVDLSDISIERQTRPRPFGMVDYLIVNVTRRSATVLGLWLAAAFLQARCEVYGATLTSDDTEVDEIRLEKPSDEPGGSADTPRQFVWTPEPLEQFLERQQRDFPDDLPWYFLADAAGEWNTLMTGISFGWAAQDRASRSWPNSFSISADRAAISTTSM